jgi:hypothetical protein
MAAFDDLAPCDYFGHEWADTLVAVGWIESRAQFTPTSVDATFFDALTALLCDPWQPFAFGGGHRCTMCTFSGGPGTLRYADRTITMGSTNLFVFSEQRAYVCPSLIAHYIDAHAYAPPAEFQETVVRSPPMKSIAYLKLLRKHGVHRLAVPKGVPEKG